MNNEELMHIGVLRELSATLIGRSEQRHEAIEWALSRILAQPAQADVERDAARYRWLRDNYQHSLELVYVIQLFTPEQLDDAIDAAMLAAAPEELLP